MTLSFEGKLVVITDCFLVRQIKMSVPDLFRSAHHDLVPHLA